MFHVKFWLNFKLQVMNSSVFKGISAFLASCNHLIEALSTICYVIH